MIAPFLASLSLVAEEAEAILDEIDALLDPGYDLLEEVPGKSETYLFAEIYGGVGHTDNVFLEPNPITASYARVAANVFATIETPKRGSLQIFLIYDESVYEDVDLNGSQYDVPGELIVYGDLKWTYLLSHYEVSLGAAYSYAEYFFEPFEEDPETAAFLQEKRPIATLEIFRQTGRDLKTGLRIGLEKPRYDGTADDFDLLRFESTTRWDLSRKHALQFRLGYIFEDYVEAPERSPTASSLPGTSLEINRFFTEVRWNYAWSTKGMGRWRLPLRAEVRDDSGGGYYDSWRIGFYPELRWSWSALDFELKGSLDYVEYAERAVSSRDLTSRWQVRSKAQFEVAHKIGLVKLWAKAEWSELDSNVPTILYESKAIETGLSMDF